MKQPMKNYLYASSIGGCIETFTSMFLKRGGKVIETDRVW